MNNFLSGVLTGIFTSIIIYLFRYAIANIFNLLVGLFSRKIRGKWKTKFCKNGQSFEESAEIKQLFHWVWGEIIYPNRSRKYKFKGTIHSSVIVATYEIKNEKDTIDRGAFTLLINPMGKANSMIGKYSWTDDTTQSPEANTYEWEKND